MKIVPLNDQVLIKVATPKSLGYLGAVVSFTDRGEVVALGPICGRSEAQGLKPGMTVLFDKNEARSAGGFDEPDLYLVSEDYIRAMLVEDATTDDN